MNRRQFLHKGALLGIAGLLKTNSWGNLSPNEHNLQSPCSLVAVQNGSPDQMLNYALKALGGIEQFVKKGQSIVIKPNIAWNTQANKAATTNPRLIAALTEKCFEAGAKEVLVFDHTIDYWKDAYDNSAIAKAVQAAGGIMIDAHDEQSYQTIKLPHAICLKSVKIHKAILNCDAWINVPILKHHADLQISSALKNIMGIVWDRLYWHTHNLHQCIADCHTLDKKPILNIIDAYRVLSNYGPKGSAEHDIITAKTLLASSDIVAVDVAAMKFFNHICGVDIKAISYIDKASKLRLGNADLNALSIRRIQL